MAFNLEDYETVEQRIQRFYGDYPDGRIITIDYTTQDDRAVGMWRVQALVFLSREEQAADLPKATGVAFEIDGQGMANKTSGLENAETSAIGRALANANYSGNKRTSREEMEKVKRSVTPKPSVVKIATPENFINRINDAVDKNELRALYREAVQGGWLEDVQGVIDARLKVLDK